jgi:hypothetical protein
MRERHVDHSNSPLKIRSKICLKRGAVPFAIKRQSGSDFTANQQLQFGTTLMSLTAVIEVAIKNAICERITMLLGGGRG